MIQAMLRVHGGIKRIPNNMENYVSFPWEILDSSIV